AVTAGHCRIEDGGVVRTRSGRSGTFQRAIFESPYSGGADYALVDFGSTAMAGDRIGDIPASRVHPDPKIGQKVCRTGISSGQHCGTVVEQHGPYQFLTTGMPSSIPGDSGGPVWIPTRNGWAQIIGIWLGEKSSRLTSIENGRFASLADGLHLLGDTA
ncbi:trypsin-like serine protease, partial [Mycobacterium asiaticum]